jgi:hypothetical protein
MSGKGRITCPFDAYKKGLPDRLNLPRSRIPDLFRIIRAILRIIPSCPSEDIFGFPSGHYFVIRQEIKQ